jgi:hypothetical protein
MENLNWYISGFADGEGCFCISFQPNSKFRIGWEVRPSFSISQNQSRSELLFHIKKIWNCGSIRPDRSDKTVKFEVRAIDEIINIVIPHFEKYPLYSSKNNDFLIFREACNLIKSKKHESVEGFKKIANIAFQMNSTGKRKYSISDILNSLKKDEGIVYATSNSGNIFS